MGLRRGHHAKPLEWLAEKLIFVVSLSAILIVFLIFIFIGREALPVIFGQMNTALVQKTIPVEQMDKLSPAELQEYLGLTKSQFASMDRDTLKELMALKIESSKDSSKDKDATVKQPHRRYR